MPGSRFQTAAEKTKALRQYETLKRSGMVVKAVVIAELKGGDFHVLGQNLTPMEMAPLLLVASEALSQAEAQRRVVKLVARVEPERRGEHNKAPSRAKRIRKAPDGVLIPPKGENFVSCGECSHPQWHILHDDATDTTTGYACSHCGNEVQVLKVGPGNVNFVASEGRA
jgi:hypothetical protein